MVISIQATTRFIFLGMYDDFLVYINFELFQELIVASVL